MDEINNKTEFVAIIGAGPAGLAAAYTLTKQKQHEVHVFEASDRIGGLAASISLWQQTVDLGPHRFFTLDPRVKALWSEIIGPDFTIVPRLTRILYRRTFFNYPLQLFNLLKNLSTIEIFHCFCSYIANRQTTHPIRSFEDWVVTRFGKKLFQIFFKTYTEKVWGIPCDRLDADWASQRIRKFSLFEAIKSVFAISRQKHRTLVDHFIYPKGGTGTVYNKMAQAIVAKNGQLHLKKAITQITLSADHQVTGLYLNNGEFVSTTHIISTMPITQLVAALPHPPAQVLKAAESLYFRNTILVYLEIPEQDLFPDNWLYVHSPEVRHGRVTNFRNWCPSLYAESTHTILCLEYWCFDHDDIWNWQDSQLAKLAHLELQMTQILPTATPYLNFRIIRLPKSYPVYEMGYQKHLKIIQNYLDSIKGLQAIGRYGAFKYNNQDHSLLMGILASENIMQQVTATNLWTINSAQEYQETGPLNQLTQ